MDLELDAFMNRIESFKYLTKLSEDFLFERFLPVLRNPPTDNRLVDFSEEQRDSLARMRHRAVLHMMRGPVPVAPRVEAAASTDTELRAMVATLQTQVKF